MKEHIKSAQIAIAAYSASSDVETKNDALTFLVADLLHWALANNIDFGEAFTGGMWHFFCEVAEERGLL